MIITNHVWTGAVIGAVAPGPVSAFAAGVVSHFVLDQVPHWGDDSIFMEVAVPDGLVGLAALGALARTARGDRRASVVAGPWPGTTTAGSSASIAAKASSQLSVSETAVTPSSRPT